MPPQVKFPRGSDVDSLKTFPDLAAAAFRHHEATQYRLWLILRAMASERSGAWVHVDDLRPAYVRLTSNVNDRAWARLLASGEGDWWKVNRDRVFLVGLGQVCERLETRPGWPVLLPESAFRHLRVFKAMNFAAWAASREHGVMASLETLQRLYGVSSRTIQRWRRIAKVTAIKNVGQAPFTEIGPLARWEIQQTRPFFWTRKVRGRMMIEWQLPNRYVCDHLTRAPRGMARKVRVALANNGGERTQIFFARAKALAKHAKGGVDAYLFQRFDDRACLAFWTWTPRPRSELEYL